MYRVFFSISKYIKFGWVNFKQWTTILMVDYYFSNIKIFQVFYVYPSVSLHKKIVIVISNLLLSQFFFIRDIVLLKVDVTYTLKNLIIV